MSTKEYQLHTVWSIKKETFLNSKEEIESKIFWTTLPKVFYQVHLNPDYNSQSYTAIQVLLFINDNEDESERMKLKQMNFKISSAKFEDVSPDEICPFPWNTDCGAFPTVFIKREDILNPEKKYFVDDILTMEIRGIFTYEKSFMDLGQILLQKNNKDFTIFVNGETVKAHKFILRQFSSILGHGDSDEITIENFDSYTVKKAVKLCYEIKFSNTYSASVLYRIIKFTKTYDMPSIKEQLEHKLAETITAENVCELANKSLELKAEILRCFCVDFLSDCIKNGKPFNGTLNDLNLEIKKLVFDNSFCHTSTS